jgi:hypothetical protein
MTRFVVGDDRSQSTLFPERLDDYLCRRKVAQRRGPGLILLRKDPPCATFTLDAAG